MKITRDNYESWFLDYLEGQLDDGMVDEFIEFIRHNNDLKEELLLYEPLILEKEKYVFPGKESLYKEILDQPDAFENAIIARMEGDISPEEDLLLGDYLSRHPEKKSELDLYLQTKLYPDHSIVFARRGMLYQQTTLKMIFTWSTRIAAVVLLGWMGFSLAKWSGGEDEKVQTATEYSLKSQNESPSKKDYPGNNSATSGKMERAESPKISVKAGSLASADVPAKKNMGPAGNAKAKNKERNTVPADIFRKSEEMINERKETALTYRDKELIPSYLSAIPCQIHPENNVLLLTCRYTIPGAEEKALAENLSLRQWLWEKTGLNHLTFNKILHSGLNLASDLSNERFKYKTNREGEIIALNLETHILGLSIPIKK